MNTRLARPAGACRARGIVASALIASAAAGCDTAPAPDAPDVRDASAEVSTPDAADVPTADVPTAVADVRGRRYCEILVGTLAGTQVHIDVYNTFGLNDCPMEAWSAIDADRLRAELSATVVNLNGPRYWLMDAFENTAPIDPTPRTLGGLPMRLSGTLDLPLADALSGGQPYTPRTVARTTTWVFAAGRPVSELVDPAGRVFAMQSYSVQRAPLTAERLQDLGAMLTLPAGWRYRTRTPATDLRVTAIDGVATVVQDDLANTYQLSQQ